MPNPNKKIDCSVIYDTYAVLYSCPPFECAKEIAGGKFVSPEYTMMLINNMEKTQNKFDVSGKNGEYIVYPGSTSNLTQKHLANTEAQKKLFDEHSKILVNELDELAGSENLKDYPALKGYIEYRNKFVKAAIEGTDRWAVMAEMPGGYTLKASPDWTDKKQGHEKTAKQFEEMFVGMKYDKLFALTDEYVDLELKMRNKVLTPDELDECKAKRIDQNNRMIGIYEHQKSPESKEKYWEFFQKYDDTIAGKRGVDKEINQLTQQNQALENGWDVSRLHLFLKMKDIAAHCKKAEGAFEYFDDPALKKVKEYSKKIADLDPVDRKFESMEAFDEYMTKYHLAMTDLVNEASKPEVHAALYNVNKVLLMKRDRGVSRCSKRLLRPPSKLVIYVTTG